MMGKVYELRSQTNAKLLRRVDGSFLPCRKCGKKIEVGTTVYCHARHGGFNERTNHFIKNRKKLSTSSKRDEKYHDFIKTSVRDGNTMPPKIYHIDCAREYNLV